MPERVLNLQYLHTLPLSAHVSAGRNHLPFMGLVDADSSLVMQVANPADSSTPSKSLHFSSGCCCHCLPEGQLRNQLMSLLNGLLIITWRVQETCTGTTSQAEKEQPEV